MILNTKETRKMENFIDIFRGTCELNGYEPIRVYGEVDSAEIQKASRGKVYYLSDEKGEVTLSMIDLRTDNFPLGELINMGVKTLQNAGIYEAMVIFDASDEESFKSLVEDLETLDIPCGFEKLKKGHFEIRVDDDTVGKGRVEEGKFIALDLYYNDIDKHYKYKEEGQVLDVHIVPKSRDVLSDAFVISSNLKDAGLTTEVDYSLGIKPLDNSVFIVEIDEQLLKNYKVKLIDRNTHEERELSIDDLAEALLFI